MGDSKALPTGGWGGVEEDDEVGSGSRKWIDVAGTYILSVIEAWDSKFAPEGHGDHGRSRCLGITCKVVGPKGTPQMNNAVRAQLWLTGGTVSRVKAVMSQVFNLEIPVDAQIDNALDVAQLVDRVFQAPITLQDPVTIKVKNKDGEMEEIEVQYPEIESNIWSMGIVDLEDGFEDRNKTGEIGEDKEGTSSHKHYEVAAKRKQDSDKKKSDQEDDDDLPF